MRFSLKLLPRRIQGWRRWVLAAGTVLFALSALWATLTIATWPDVEALKEGRPSTTAFIERYKKRQRDAGRSDAVSWTWASWDRISPWLKKAVLAAEDTEFFAHRGFSVHETRQAIREALARGEAPRGASTVTQQLAKNLWLSPERSLTRKAREAILTSQLEKHLTKRRILELYLNVVEFGPGVYGAEAAARRFFNKPASALSEREGAMLAAGLPRSTWHPESDSQYYARRVEHLRDLMPQLTYLDGYVGLTARPSGPDSVAPPRIGAAHTAQESVAAQGSATSQESATSPDSDVAAPGPPE